MSCIVVSTFVFDCDSAPTDPLKPRLHDFIPFSQAVGRSGTEWARGLSDPMSLRQTDYFFEILPDPMSLSGDVKQVKDLFEFVTHPMGLVDTNITLSGGRPSVEIHITEAVFDSNTSKGMAIYVNSSGRANIAIASDPSTSLVIGLALFDVQETKVGKYQTEGTLELDDWTTIIGSQNLEPGKEYYLADFLIGRMSVTPPSDSGDSIVAIGTALTTKILSIEIAQPILL